MIRGERKSFLPIEPVEFDFGGRLTAPSSRGGETTMTRLGEFEAHEHDGGGAMMIFPERGIVVYYATNGQVGLVNVNMSWYFEGVSEEQIDELPNHGRSVREFVKAVEESPAMLHFAVMPMTGEVKLIQVNRLSGDSVELADLGSLNESGYLSGSFVFEDEIRIAYAVSYLSETEINIGLGEAVDKNGTVIDFAVSPEVDYERYMFQSRDPRRLQDLAESVLKIDGSIFG